MSKSPYARPSPTSASRSRDGYDGKVHYPDRRVSLSVHALLIGTLRTGLEARGLALGVFCRHFDCDEAPEAEHIRLELGLTKRRFQKILEEARLSGLVEVRGTRLHPAGPLGVDPDARQGKPRNTRDMPSDWLEIRDAVFERDAYGCVYCGSGRDLHCDHVTPVVRGGGHGAENLVTACANCNLSKGSRTVAEWRPELAEAIAKIVEDRRGRQV